MFVQLSLSQMNFWVLNVFGPAAGIRTIWTQDDSTCFSGRQVRVLVKPWGRGFSSSTLAFLLVFVFHIYNSTSTFLFLSLSGLSTRDMVHSAYKNQWNTRIHLVYPELEVPNWIAQCHQRAIDPRLPGEGRR